ncbi:MAG: sensor histidine kinase [Ferrovibrio sp.]
MTFIAPLPANEDQRLATLQDYRILDTAPDERFDRLTAFAADLFDVPVALVSLIDAERQWFKSHHGLPVSETPRSISFCAHTILNDEALIVEDAAEHPLFQGNPLVLDGPRLRFYAGVPLTADDGQRIGTLCIGDSKPRTFSDKDSLRLRRLAAVVSDELELHRARMEAESSVAAQNAANQLKSKLLSSMNHEFRTPLNAILGFSQILELNMSKRLGKEELEYVAAVKTAGENLLRLSDSMMTMAQIEADVVPFGVESISAQSLIEEVYTLHRPAAALNGIAFMRRACISSVGLKADHSHMLRILGSFMSNAFKYTPLGGEVTLGCATDEDRVTFYVEDTGCGIAADRQRDAFQSFNRLGREGSTVAGLGLGLAIASRLTRAMKGEIGFESSEGRGSRFWVRFPIA